MKEFKGVQREILDCKNNNQLVSAGAGSGKTTIMIEKISNLVLNENLPIENLLVVTFTVLAAGEMKDRLIANFLEKLGQAKTEQEKEHLLNLIEQTKTASIDTIDGFASKTIKKYFYELNISPNIEILPESTRDYYLNRAIKITLNNFSKQGDNLAFLLDLFGGKNRHISEIEKIILDCYNKVINIEEYEEFLNKSLNEYLNPQISEKIVNDAIVFQVEKLKTAIKNCQSEIFADRLNEIYNNLQQVNKNLILKHNLKALTQFKKFTKTDIKKDVDVMSFADELDNYNAFVNKLLESGIDEKYDEKNAKVANYFKLIIQLIKDFIKNYNTLKQKNNYIDFNDLNRLMLKLLENKKVKSELQQKYTHIFVDEYQDVNPLQDALINKIITNKTKVFFVGDVKQSIYGFRGASPEWFIKKYNGFKQEKEGMAFDMNCNFRSNPKILNFVNTVFSKLMLKSCGDVDYKKDCIIEPERKDIVDDKVKILLAYNSDTKEQLSGVYSVKNHEECQQIKKGYNESILVFKQISKMVGTTFYDANLKTKRILKFSDIAILTRAEKDEETSTLIDVLRAGGIPVNINNKLNIAQSEGIKLILSILKCVNNTADDVDYLAVLLCLTDMEINEIIALRDIKKSFKENLIENLQNEKIKNCFATLESIKNNSYTKTNSELIRSILNDNKLKYYILRLENGERELGQIEEFLNHISTNENNLNLAEFVELVESNLTKSNTFLQTDGENSVTIQTIHKSKGLEYPVVFIFNSAKELGFVREKDAINFNSNIGFGVDYFDLPTRTKCYSLTKYAIKLANFDKGYKEELRLLYVAMTRAKNKLIITGESDGNFKNNLPKNNYLNIILSCFDNFEESANHQFQFVDKIELENLQEKSNRKINKFYENFDYKDKDKFSIPFKNTVTGLNSKISQEYKFETKKWLSPSIQYEVGEDRASIGVHYHKELENLDLTKPYIEAERSFDDVDYEKIKQAHKILSPLAKNAINIKHEADFMMYVPYNEVVNSTVKDKVLIQGVVDLIIEYENSITIVDYKFSRLPIDILKQKYSEQLELYKLAVEKAFNKKVDKTLIYSIETGELL